MILHTKPIDDINPHENETTCACEPIVEFVNGNMCVFHNAFDGRHILEEANEILGLENKKDIPGWKIDTFENENN